MAYDSVLPASVADRVRAMCVERLEQIKAEISAVMQAQEQAREHSARLQREMQELASVLKALDTPMNVTGGAMMGPLQVQQAHMGGPPTPAYYGPEKSVDY